MRRAYVIGCLSVVLVAGCESTDHGDLRRWMQGVEKDMKGKIPPLPQVKPYEPLAYEAGSLVDPFNPARTRSEAPGRSAIPDLNRPRDPLEEFPLETLTFVGFFKDQKRLVAQILVNGKSYDVRVGQHMGQNFGKIVRIDTTKDEEKIVLKELVQEADGAWVDRESVLYLGGKGG